jgi:dethiobiotin synthetase
MKKRIFVTATNTDIGKTYTTKLLLEKFTSRGISVGVIKLIETGVDNIAHDGEELLKIIKELNENFIDINITDIVPISYKLPAAPIGSAGGIDLDLKKLDRAVEKLE